VCCSKNQATNNLAHDKLIESILLLEEDPYFQNHENNNNLENYLLDPDQELLNYLNNANETPANENTKDTQLDPDPDQELNNYLNNDTAGLGTVDNTADACDEYINYNIEDIPVIIAQDQVVSDGTTASEDITLGNGSASNISVGETASEAFDIDEGSKGGIIVINILNGNITPVETPNVKVATTFKDQSLLPKQCTNAKKDADPNEKYRAYRKRKNQKSTNEELALQEEGEKNKRLRMQADHLENSVKMLKDWYIKSIQTRKIVCSSF